MCILVITRSLFSYSTSSFQLGSFVWAASYPMADLATDVQKSFAAAQSSQRAYCDGLVEFDVACSLGNDAELEIARQKVIGAMESFMDHHAAAYRRMRDYK